MASIAIHGLVMVSLWSEPPRHIVDALYTGVMVEILPDDPEQSAPAHQMKAKTAPHHSRPHPVKLNPVKNTTLASTPVHASTPRIPESVVASTQTVQASRPVKTEVLTADATAIYQPASARHVQHVDQTGNHNAVRRHLEAFKYYPASARRRGIEGDVDVSFKLVHGGAAEQVKVLRGSGYAVLDHAALSTVARAQPFPVENGLFRFHLRFRRL